MPAIPGIRVARSRIDGYGVIATRAFRAGELIADVEGVVWRKSEAVDDRYSLLIADGVYMDMVDQTRWINHSCDPNAEVQVGEEPGPDGQAMIWARIVALRPISAGDEISYDYAFAADVAEPCRCGAGSCRGLIVDPDEVHLLRNRAAVTTTNRGRDLSRRRRTG